MGMFWVSDESNDRQKDKENREKYLEWLRESFKSMPPSPKPKAKLTWTEQDRAWAKKLGIMLD